MQNPGTKGFVNDGLEASYKYLQSQSSALANHMIKIECVAQDTHEGSITVPALLKDTLQVTPNTELHTRAITYTCTKGTLQE